MSRKFYAGEYIEPDISEAPNSDKFKEKSTPKQQDQTEKFDEDELTAEDLEATT